MNDRAFPRHARSAWRSGLAVIAIGALSTSCSGSDSGVTSAGAGQSGDAPAGSATSIVVLADGATSVVVVPAPAPIGVGVTEAPAADSLAPVDPSQSTPATAVPAPDLTPAPATAPPTPAAETLPPVTLPPPPPPTVATTPPVTVDPATVFNLSAAGVGQHPFGEAASILIADLTARFGEPLSDETRNFTFNGDEWIDEFAEWGFDREVGRIVCWTNLLCVTLGGPTADALTFVGWSYEGDETRSLKNAAGITLNSRWSEFPTQMTVNPGGCYTVGTGSTTDGITLMLLGEDFSVLDDSGAFVPLTPPPDKVTVLAMSAGTQMVDLFSDC